MLKRLLVFVIPFVALALFVDKSFMHSVALAGDIAPLPIDLTPELNANVYKAWIGNVISAVGSVAGGLISKSGAAGDSSHDSSERAKDRWMQEKFARSGIRWRVGDAKKAGIHPLYALGANTTAYSNTVGSTDSGDRYLGEGIARAGQDLGRAYTAAQNKEERNLSLRLAEEQVKQAGLDTEIKRLQLNSEKGRLASAQVGPPMGAIEIKPSQSISHMKDRPAIEAATAPETKYFRTKNGGLAPAYSEPITEAMEENPAGKLGWMGRNYLAPIWDKESRPPKHMLPKGYDYWSWNGIEFLPKKGKDPGTYWDRVKSRSKKSGFHKGKKRTGATRSY